MSGGFVAERNITTMSDLIADRSLVLNDDDMQCRQNRCLAVVGSAVLSYCLSVLSDGRSNIDSGAPALIENVDRNTSATFNLLHIKL